MDNITLDIKQLHALQKKAGVAVGTEKGTIEIDAFVLFAVVSELIELRKLNNT